jgi:N-acetylmuramoyl-L-alanine amidase
VKITEEEEKKPVPLYFSYTNAVESESMTATEKEEATPEYSDKGAKVSLMLKGILPKRTLDLQAQDIGQIDFNVTDQTSYEQAVTKQTEDYRQSEKYTQAEKEMIAKVVYAEARGECFDGQVAVAQVVLNRYESGEFGSSLKKIIYGRHQFAVSRRYTETCMEAVEYAVENMPYPANMYFFQVSRSKHWRNFVFYNRIGNHNFFCSKE